MKQVQDHYFKKAKRDGYSARSAYKLEEIDRRRRLFRPGAHVLDLGAAPGSWLQYAARQVGGSGHVLGVDLQPITTPLPPHVRHIVGDAFELSHQELMLGERLFDILLSDMAPKTTGIPSADAARSADLVRQALTLSGPLLKTGGAMLVKVFQGAQFPGLRKDYQARFEKVTVEKPRASRKESVEIFLLATGKIA